ncbi:uncharacterized protein [Danio rerio]|uniref:Uncharacterized protein n=1 Tax=Danio rerio TaxID=7955 RepID=A0AC58JF04_DANRE
MDNRQYWSVEDTRALLNIWAEENVQRQIDGVCRNEDVIKYIVAELAKAQIQRTTVQVREKLKKLRAQYKAIKIHNGQSGAHRKNFPWFEIMDGVLGHRPSVSGETTRDSMAANLTVDLPSNNTAMELSELEDGPSQPLISSTPERHDSTTGIRGGSHHIPPRTRPESRKRKATSLSRDFMQYIREQNQEQREAEQKLRREDREAEMLMRREELAAYMELQQKEMDRRQKDSDVLNSILGSLAAALLPKK